MTAATCRYCAEPPAAEGLQLCLGCFAGSAIKARRVANARQRRRRSEKVASGICVHGGCRQRAAKNRQQCEDHLILRSRKNSSRYHRRKEAGVCIQCGERDPKAGFVRCAACIERNAENEARRRAAA